MPKYIIKMSKDGVDRYLEWSTIVDAPTTYGLTLEEFHQYFRDEYGERGMDELPARMARVEKHGTSALEGHSVEHIIEGNRCAEWEKGVFPPKPSFVEADGETYQDLSWTFDEIWEFYVTRRGAGTDDGEDEEPELSARIRDKVAAVRSVLASMPFTAPEVQHKRWAQLKELNEEIGRLAEQIDLTTDDDDESDDR